MTRRFAIALSFLTAAIFWFGAPITKTATSQSAEPKGWIEGPVRYIMSRDEIKVFRALQDDDSRLSFIEQFWQLRDPTPGTRDNEYRNLFWSRVKYANERLAETAAPGWKSDRGKLHVLCGEPDRIETLPHADTRASATASHGLLRWFYERRPCGRTDLGPVVIVAFVREVGGDYSLTTDPRLSSLYFNPIELTDPAHLRLQRWLEATGPPGRSELSVMADLGLLQQGPHPEERIIERVETSESYGSRPIDITLARFAYPAGGALVVLTAPAPDLGKGTAPSFVARFTPRDATKAKRFLGEESFRLEGSGRDRIAQARIVLDPGLWDLIVLSVETGVARSGLYRGLVELRPSGPALALSDVVLASDIQPVQYRSLVSYDEPFLLGAFRVVPRTRYSVPLGAPVHLFFEVYGGTAPYSISYQLEGRELDGTWRELGPPAVLEDRERSQGYTLETKPSWPAGDYRFRIAVRDQAGAEATVTLELKLDRVVDSAGPSPAGSDSPDPRSAPADPPPPPKP